MRAIAAVATLGVLALAGCAPGGAGGPTLASGTAPPGFQCPAPGTSISTTDGRTMTWTGTSGSDPFACTLNTLQGGAESRLANIYTLPVYGEAALRNGLAGLWPLAPGKSVSFLHEVGSTDGALAWINTTWHVLGEQTLVVAGQPRQVLVMENIESMPRVGGYAGQWTLYYDIRARAFVGGDISVLRGTNSARNWRATSITVPGN
jgi:hypothetical protein